MGLFSARKVSNRSNSSKSGLKTNIGGMDKKAKRASEPYASGYVTEKLGVEAKQPNSAIRKAVRVQLKRNNKKIVAFIPLDGSLNIVEENDEVVVAGMGRKGLSVGDRPGVCFKVVKSSGVSLLAMYKHKKEKPRN